MEMSRDETLENEEEEEDRLSALPDCLILDILSLLPSVEDAIRTATLSKRWKSLWTSIPTLIFRYDGDSTRSGSEFVFFVNQTLNQCLQSKLIRFQLFINHDYRSEYPISDWLRFATNRNVEVLELASDRNSFLVNSCFMDLGLGGYIFDSVGEISWRSLRNLCITNGWLSEDLIEKILSGSPVLETLELHDCGGYRRLDITSKSLKNLVISGCFEFRLFGSLGDYFWGFHHGDVIEINAPNIWSLRIENQWVSSKILLADVSSLVEAELNEMSEYHKSAHTEVTEEMLKGLIQSLHHVKKLMIGNFCSKVLSRLEAKGFSSPSNIQRFLDRNEATGFIYRCHCEFFFNKHF